MWEGEERVTGGCKWANMLDGIRGPWGETHLTRGRQQMEEVTGKVNCVRRCLVRGSSFLDKYPATKHADVG